MTPKSIQEAADFTPRSNEGPCSDCHKGLSCFVTFFTTCQLHPPAKCEGEYDPEIAKRLLELKLKYGPNFWEVLLKKPAVADGAKDARAAIEALEAVQERALESADEQDGFAVGEVLSGNTVKEQAYRSAAAGLRMAVGLLTEEIENQRTCAKIDAMTPSEVKQFLASHGVKPVESVDDKLKRIASTLGTALYKPTPPAEPSTEGDVA